MGRKTVCWNKIVAFGGTFFKKNSNNPSRKVFQDRFYQFIVKIVERLPNDVELNMTNAVPPNEQNTYFETSELFTFRFS